MPGVEPPPCWLWTMRCSDSDSFFLLYWHPQSLQIEEFGSIFEQFGSIWGDVRICQNLYSFQTSPKSHSNATAIGCAFTQQQDIVRRTIEKFENSVEFSGNMNVPFVMISLWLCTVRLAQWLLTRMCESSLESYWNTRRALRDLQIPGTELVK